VLYIISNRSTSHSFMFYTCCSCFLPELSDLPPPLISVTNCDDFDLQIGGFPYSLLVKENGNYKVKPIENDDTLSGMNSTALCPAVIPLLSSLCFMFCCNTTPIKLLLHVLL